MVLVFEPVVWVDDVGGHRAEEVVAVTEDGWRPLGGGHHYAPFRLMTGDPAAGGAGVAGSEAVGGFRGRRRDRRSGPLSR